MLGKSVFHDLPNGSIPFGNLGTCHPLTKLWLSEIIKSPCPFVSSARSFSDDIWRRLREFDVLWPNGPPQHRRNCKSCTGCKILGTLQFANWIAIPRVILCRGDGSWLQRGGERRKDSSHFVRLCRPMGHAAVSSEKNYTSKARPYKRRGCEFLAEEPVVFLETR